MLCWVSTFWMEDTHDTLFPWDYLKVGVGVRIRQPGWAGVLLVLERSIEGLWDGTQVEDTYSRGGNAVPGEGESTGWSEPTRDRWPPLITGTASTFSYFKFKSQGNAWACLVISSCKNKHSDNDIRVSSRYDPASWGLNSLSYSRSTKGFWKASWMWNSRGKEFCLPVGGAIHPSPMASSSTYLSSCLGGSWPNLFSH